MIAPRAMITAQAHGCLPRRLPDLLTRPFCQWSCFLDTLTHGEVTERALPCGWEGLSHLVGLC